MQSAPIGRGERGCRITMKSTIYVDFPSSCGRRETVRARFLGDRRCLHAMSAGHDVSDGRDIVRFAGGEEVLAVSRRDHRTPRGRVHIPGRRAAPATRDMRFQAAAACFSSVIEDFRCRGALFHFSVASSASDRGDSSSAWLQRAVSVVLSPCCGVQTYTRWPLAVVCERAAPGRFPGFSTLWA